MTYCRLLLKSRTHLCYCLKRGCAFTVSWPAWLAERGSPPSKGCCGEFVAVTSSCAKPTSKILWKTPPPWAPQIWTHALRWENVSRFPFMAVVLWFGFRVTRCTSRSSSSSFREISWRTGWRRSVKGSTTYLWLFITPHLLITASPDFSLNSVTMCDLLQVSCLTVPLPGDPTWTKGNGSGRQHTYRWPADGETLFSEGMFFVFLTLIFLKYTICQNYALSLSESGVPVASVVTGV